MGIILFVIILFFILHSKNKRKNNYDYEEYDPNKWSSRREWYRSSYLHSKHWKRTREDALVRAGFRCECCKTNKHLTVHHLTYKNLGHEKYPDLLVLCWNCHKKIHRNSNNKIA